MTTTSTEQLLIAIRTRILSYVDYAAVTNDSIVAGRLYRLAAPDDVAPPYGVMALKSPQLVDGTDALKLAGDLEVQWFGRPRASQPAIEALGDRTVSALLTWRDASSGLAYIASATAESLPPFTAPADKELVQVRVLARLKAFPVFLSRLSS